MNYEIPSIPSKKAEEKVKQESETLDTTELTTPVWVEGHEEAYQADQAKADALAKRIRSGLIGEQSVESLRETEKYQEIINSFVTAFQEGGIEKLDVVGHRNLGIFEYQGKIIKLLKARRAPKPDEIERLKERVKDMANVFVVQQSFVINDNIHGVIMEKAPGISAEKLTEEQVDLIPEAHWDTLEKTTRDLSQRGVQTDFTKKSNFLYDNDAGFSFIDLEGASTDGTGTDKFFTKDGQEKYYPFERFRVIPLPYTSSKALFTNINEKAADPPSEDIS